MPDIQQIADAWAEAWMTDDTDAFLALFADEIVYRDDQAGRVSRTRDELTDFHRHFSAALSDKRIRFTNVFQAGADACMEWRFTGVHSGTYHGRPPTGKALDVPGVSVLKLTSDGRISACVDIYNGALVARQLAPEA